MTDQALDQLARRILLDAARQEYGELMREPLEHDFTPAFEKKMQKLLRRAKHPAWHQFAQAAASLLLVIFLTGCAVLAVSPEVREVFAGWVREVYENYFVYRYAGQEETDTDNMVYRPTWMPDGWQESDVSEDNDVTHVIYTNDEGAFMVFVCAKDPEASNVYIDNGDYVDAQEIQMQGGKADLYMDNREGHSNVIVWTDEETGVLFLIHGPLASGELVRMAESVKPVQLETFYRPTWIPEGYVQQEEKPLYGQVNLEYRSENGAFIFIYIPDPDEGQPVYIDPTEAEQSKAQVNGRPAEVYIYDMEGAMNIILWSDESGTIFLITGTLTKDELIRVAESVELVPREYYPDWLPEGYELINKSVSDAGPKRTFFFENQDGEDVIFIYDTSTENPLYVYPNEGHVEKNVLVGGRSADLFLSTKEGLRSELYWSDPETGTLFIISGTLAENELLKMAESVGIVPRDIFAEK